jgi:steroid delta-isomerase
VGAPSFQDLLRGIPSGAGRSRIAQAVRAYLSHDYADAEGRAEFYALDAVLEDPAGASPLRGRSAILESFRQTLARGLRSKIESRKVVVSGNEAVALCQAHVTVQGRRYLEVPELIMCLRFDDEAKIVSLKAFFDEDSVTSF